MIRYSIEKGSRQTCFFLSLKDIWQLIVFSLELMHKYLPNRSRGEHKSSCNCIISIVVAQSLSDGSRLPTHAQITCMHRHRKYTQLTHVIKVGWPVRKIKEIFLLKKWNLFDIALILYKLKIKLSKTVSLFKYFAE